MWNRYDLERVLRNIYDFKIILWNRYDYEEHWEVDMIKKKSWGVPRVDKI